jgi:hypothetical protein
MAATSTRRARERAHPARPEQSSTRGGRLVKRVLASLVGTGVVLVLTLMPSSPSTALDSGPRSPEPNVRQIDLRLGQGVSSITARRNGGNRGFTVKITRLFRL